MFTVVKEVTFDAAHYLPGYVGKCSGMHGHTWRVQLGISADSLPADSGMVIDFKIMEEALLMVISKLDHSVINDTMRMPTAEYIAVYIYEKVRDELVRKLPCFPTDSRMEYVRVWETPTNFVEYIVNGIHT